MHSDHHSGTTEQSSELCHRVCLHRCRGDRAAEPLLQACHESVLVENQTVAVSFEHHNVPVLWQFVTMLALSDVQRMLSA